jgi:prevent-host-death family protein
VTGTVRDSAGLGVNLVYNLVMPTVNIHEAKTHLSRLLERAMAGEDIVITKAGKPLVRLTPVTGAPVRRVIGTAKGDFVVPEDFDSPLPDDILDAFES